LRFIRGWRRKRTRDPKPEEKLDFIGGVMAVSERFALKSHVWRMCRSFIEELLANQEYLSTVPNRTELVEELTSLAGRCDMNIIHRRQLAPKTTSTPKREKCAIPLK